MMISPTAPTNWNPRCRRMSLAEKQAYKQWRHIRGRCINPKDKMFKLYGAKGILLHGEWHDFALFFRAVGSRPSIFHNLHRLDVQRHFEPGNVEWLTDRELKEKRALIERPEDRFMREGSFDWDAWRDAGAPE